MSALNFSCSFHFSLLPYPRAHSARWLTIFSTACAGIAGADLVGDAMDAETLAIQLNRLRDLLVDESTYSSATLLTENLQHTALG